MTPIGVQSNLPDRVGGEFGLDVIVTELGGNEEFIKYCRLSTNPKIQQMVRLWDQSESPLRKRFSFQDLCAHLMIDGIDVMTDIVTNLYIYHGSMARIMNAVAIKDVMKTSIEVAKTEDGVDDRKIQLGMAGLMPKQGPLVNVNVDTRGHGVESEIEAMDSAIDVTPNYVRQGSDRGTTSEGGGSNKEDRS